MPEHAWDRHRLHRSISNEHPVFPGRIHCSPARIQGLMRISDCVLGRSWGTQCHGWKLVSIHYWLSLRGCVSSWKSLCTSLWNKKKQSPLFFTAAFNLRIYSTVCLETFSGALLALFLHQTKDDYFGKYCFSCVKFSVTKFSRLLHIHLSPFVHHSELCSIRVMNNPCIENLPISATLPPLIVALMMLLLFQRHYLQRKPFGREWQELLSIFNR